jgi:hypothetical protein
VDKKSKESRGISCFLSAKQFSLLAQIGCLEPYAHPSGDENPLTFSGSQFYFNAD